MTKNIREDSRRSRHISSSRALVFWLTSQCSIQKVWVWIPNIPIKLNYQKFKKSVIVIKTTCWKVGQEPSSETFVA